MKNKWLVVLLVLSFIKGLVWLFFTPIFQVPDEPSHFSYVQFLAEQNRSPHPRREVVSSQELFTVANIVNFNWKIEHPVWRGLPAGWADKIKQLDPSIRQEYRSNPYLTSLKRPGLYYAAASGFYRLFFNQSFLWRFFAVRFFSLICQLGTIWLVYLTAIKLTKKPWLGLASAAGVSFHPGFSFIAGGVSYEALGILIATAFIYLMTIQAKTRWLLLAGTIGILIKPDLIFLLLLIPFLLPKKLKWFAFLSLIAVFIGLVLISPLVNQEIWIKSSWLDRFLYTLPLKDYANYANQLIQLLSNKQILPKTIEYLQIFIQVHYNQVFAWYWGVFGWLEKTLPPLVYFVLKLLVLLSLLGLIKAKKIKFLILSVVLQALIIILNDWLVFIATGQIYGIQGRYFLPAISAQMILFVLGLSRFIPPKLIIIGAVFLNLIGLFSLFQYFGNVWF